MVPSRNNSEEVTFNTKTPLLILEKQVSRHKS